MKKFLLDTKWVGVLCSLIVSLILAARISGFTTAGLRQIMPYVVSETADFLPITIENGEIVQPRDAYIAKNYGSAQNPMLVVLDTRSDELSTEQIKDRGLYLSRKFMYGVTNQKTEIRNFEKFPNATIDVDMLNQASAWLDKNAGSYIFMALFFGLLVYIAIVVLLCAGIIQLLLGKLLKVDFGRTVRVTTLTYLILLLLGVFVISFNIYIVFAILVASNYGVAKYIPQN